MTHRDCDRDQHRAGAAKGCVHALCPRLSHPVDLCPGLLDTRHDVIGVFRVIADSPIRDRNEDRTSRGYEIENQAKLFVVQWSDGVIARRNLRRERDGVGMFGHHFRNRHREITDQRCVNDIAEIDDAYYAVPVDEGVHLAYVVVNHLGALLL